MTETIWPKIIMGFFWCSLSITALYIATIGSLGIYYDYQLISEYPIISLFNGGGIGLDEFLNRYENYYRKYKVIGYGSGRFHPGYLFDLLFISKTFSSINALWVYKAALFSICMVTVFGTTLLLVNNKILASISTLLLFFHPGFWYIWTTLASTSDAQAMVFLSTALFFYMRNREHETTWNKAWCLLSVVVAFGFKEPVFITVGVFATTHLVLNFKTNKLSEMKMDMLILGVVFFFFCLYFAAAIWPFIRDGISDEGLYFDMKSRGTTIEHGVSKFWYHLKAYGLSDPFLVFVLLPLTILHFGQLFSGPFNADDKLVAAFLAAGTIWLAQYLTLGISDTYFKYYGVPAYCFAVPAIAAKVKTIFINPSESTRRWAKMGQRIVIIGLFGLSVLIQGTVNPNAIDWFLNNRMDFKYWEQTIDKSAEIVSSNRPEKTYFYFYKSPRDSTVELFESYTTFMVSRGLLPKDFDLTYASNDNIAWAGHMPGKELGGPNAPWGWRRNYRAREMRTGDYLIVNSWWPFISNNEIDEVLHEWELIFQTNGLYDCGTFSIRGILTYLVRSAREYTAAPPPSTATLGKTANQIKPYLKYGLCSPFTNRRNFYIFKKR